MSENITYVPFKPGMSIKSGDSVFVFNEGITVETFEKDEDFRSGMVTTVVAGKVRVEWDGTVSTDSRRFGAKEYEYVAKSRFTRIEKNTWVLDHMSDSAEKSTASEMDAMYEKAEASEKAEMAALTETTEKADVPAPRRSRGSSAKSAK